MSFLLEIALRFLKSGRSGVLGLTSQIAASGLVLGVSSLVVSMAVVAGFERTLERTVTDLTGHLQIRRQLGGLPQQEELRERLKSLLPGDFFSTPTLWIEGVAARQGKMHGVLLQGLDPQSFSQVLRLDDRIRSGGLAVLSESANGEITPVVIGKGVADRLGLQVGDEFRIVIPLPSDYDPQKFSRKVSRLKVGGTVDLGKYDFDERIILMPLVQLQAAAAVGDRVSGLLLRLNSAPQALEIAGSLQKSLGPAFGVRSWFEMNENLFEAIRIERVVIFFVILIIVIAAAFNVASTLSISVVQKYPEIAVLKSMGLKSHQVMLVFCLQGFGFGFIGSVLGFLGGFVLGFLFEKAQSVLHLLPGSVYKLDRIDVLYRPVDLLGIFVITLLICVVATIGPALRGARLGIIEGTRYD